MDDIVELNKTAISLLQKSKFTEAIDVLKKCKELNPFEFSYSYNLGYAYEKSNHIQEALTEYFRAIEKNLEDYRPIFRIGLIQARKGNYKEALDYFDNALNISNTSIDNAEIIYHKAVCYQRLGILRKAISEITKAITIDDRNAQYYELRGHIHFLSKEFKLAEQDFSDAISLNNLSIGAYFGRADVYIEINEADKAISDYTKILEINNDELNALYKRGIALAKKKDYSNAIIDFETIARVSPDEINCFSNLGTCYLNLKELDKAILSYTKVIDKNPESIECLLLRGMLSYYQKQSKQAYKDLTEVLRLAKIKSYPVKQTDDILYTLALIELEDEKYNEAISWLLDCNLDTYLVILVKTIHIFSEKNQTLLFKKFHDFHEIVLEIKKLSHSNVDVSHYTSLSVADKIVSGTDNKIRFYNVAYMNDPEEGKGIYKLLNDELVNILKHNSSDENDNVYLGSFLPSDSADELIMWRTYGKEKGEEAKGCSISIGFDFFDDFYSSAIGRNNQNLSKVVYVNKVTGKIISENSEAYLDKFEKLNKSYIEISEILMSDEFNDGAFPAEVLNLLKLSLSEISFLFKSSDFSYENELRVIIVSPFDSELVKIDNSQFPQKLYIESNKNIRESIKKIVLGPKVDNPSHWIYLKALLKRESNNIQLKESTCSFK